MLPWVRARPSSTASPPAIRSLADYRLRHATYKLDPDLARLHQLHPFIATWDDHETCNNSRRDSAENHNPGEGDWYARKAAAQRAYSEWMPVRTTDPARIYRTLRYGTLADIIVLDTRLEGRDDEVGQTGALLLSGREVDDPARELISATQRQFLFDALQGSRATWKVLAQQVVLGQWNVGGLPRVDAPDTPLITPRQGGNALNPDAWDGYTAERSRLFGHLRNKRIQNVVVLTGDVHSSWAMDLTDDPYDPLRYNPLTGAGSLGVEVVTPSVTSASLAESLRPELAPVLETGLRADNPHLKYVELSRHGYVLLDLDAARAQADWYFVETVLEPTLTEAFGAGWQVEAGAGHLSPVAGPSG